MPNYDADEQNIVHQVNGLSLSDVDRLEFPEVDQFPTLFENGRVHVFTNGSGEIFVKNVHTNVQIRISDNAAGLCVTSGNGQGRFTPWSVNGLPAFLVSN